MPETAGDDRGIDAVISDAMTNGDQTAVLQALSETDLYVPRADASAAQNSQPGANGTGPDQTATDAPPVDGGTGDVADDEAIALPVLEQDGTQYVPVFTSEQRAADVGAGDNGFYKLPATTLSAGWPDDNLWLALNPGSSDGLTIPPGAVRIIGNMGGESA